MVKAAKAHRRGERYGPFLSVGNILEIRSEGLHRTAKVQFLPQFAGDKDPEAVLSKRFLAIDLGISDIARGDLRSMAQVAKGLANAARTEPETLLKLAGAFGQSGSREDREAALGRARKLGLMAEEGPDGPYAIWVGILLVGAAILIAGCCQETDTDCGDGGTDTDNDKGGGTGGTE